MFRAILGSFRKDATRFQVDARFAAFIASVFCLRSSRTPSVLKLVALRFRRLQSWELSLLTPGDRRQELPQTVESLRDPPSALRAVFPDAFVSLPLNR